jgi:acyl-CoA thioester hydrolase
MGAPFAHRLRVRYHECDAQGHVFNANYLTFVDVAITELWRAALGSYDAMLAGGVDMVVAESQLRFLAPARFDDEIDVGLAVARLGTTGMSTEIEIARGGEVLVTGTVRHVFVAVDGSGKVSIPDAVRAGLQPYALAAPAR